MIQQVVANLDGVEALDPPIERLEAPALRQLLEYFRRVLEPAKGSRRRIDPLSVQFVLGNLILLDVLPNDYRVRLFGANLAFRAGYDLTGRSISAMPDPRLRQITIGSLDRVCETMKPHWAARYRKLGETWVGYETLILPLAGPAEDAEQAVIALVYKDVAPRPLP